MPLRLAITSPETGRRSLAQAINAGDQQGGKRLGPPPERGTVKVGVNDAEASKTALGNGAARYARSRARRSAP